MRETITNLLERYLSGRGMSPEQFLWSVLVFGLIVSGIHLLTMMSTRWGNRAITTKALVFSLVVHLSCISGMVAVEPRPFLSPTGGREEEKTAVIELRGYADGIPDAVDNPQEPNADADGETPVWDKIAEPPPVELSRSTPSTTAAPTPIEVMRPESAPVAQPELNVEVPVMLPDAPSATPHPEAAAAATTLKKNTSPEAPVVDAGGPPEARPELAAPAVTSSRTNPATARAASPNATRETHPLPRTNSVEESSNFPLPISDAPATPEADIERGPQPEATAASDRPAPGGIGAPEPVATNAPESPARTGAGSTSRPSVRTRTIPSPESGSPGVMVERARPDGRPAPETSSREELIREAIGRGPLANIGPAPEVVRPDIGTVRTRKNSGVPSTYRLRNLAKRPQIARAMGGTDESEKAVEASLKWLAENQHPEGYWDASAHGAGQVKVDETGVDRNHAGKDADAGVTALAVLAFLAAGYTHEEGQYAEQVDRAVTWLIRQQRPDGNLGFGAGHFAEMYCHGMATYALAEAYGMQSDPATNTRLRDPVARAVGYILDNQNPKDGGWRYKKGQEGDMSMFGWQLMALKSAEIAGIRIPSDARTRMVAFLRERSLGDNQGLAGYRRNQPPTPAMTAEALFCKQMLGIKRNNAACTEAVAYLLARPPKRSDWNEYYWYYGTLAMYQYGGPEWTAWNEALRDQLISEQRTVGELAGSWDPRAPWGRYGGRVYSTALATLCLEVYYRFLPLYQIGGPLDEQ